MSSLTIELPAEVRAEEATLMMAMKLWEVGRLSLGQAASLAGYSKPAFIEILGKYGIPVFNQDPDDLESELRT